MQERSLPSNEIANKSEQAILKEFGDFEGRLLTTWMAVEKRLIGDGGQRLAVTYFNANSERKTIQATVICLNGAYLRVCEVGDVNEIAKSIKLNKLINVQQA